ncbi:MAG: MBOAT family protein [Phycisphaeraceae bacterium]
MLFSEPAFLFVFLPLLFGLYFVPGLRSLRNPLLLLFSLFFYAWGEKYFVLMMLVSIAFNYAMGLWVDRGLRQADAKGGAPSRWPIVLTIVGNLGLLGVYKYADLFAGTVNALLGPLGLHLDPPGIQLPIGISFFTFQAMSYVIDVYRRQAEVQRNPLNIALYISLFPQLIAGPIVRYKDVAEQIISRVVTSAQFAYGIRRFIIGLGKKMIIANTCALVADEIFGAGGAAGNAAMPGVPLDHLTPSLAWLAVLCYTLQIYFDFSAYSDMAIGLGHMFGFKFLENFNYPYISQSITEFWRRWHMSLSTWFRDYLYIPLGGNRGSPARVYRNLLIVFLLCGLWHGASWTFVLWGLYHGLFLVVERLGFGSALTRSPRPLRHLYTLLVAMVGWVFFRAETLPQAFAVLQAMIGFGGTAATAGVWYRPEMYLDVTVTLVILAGVIGATPIWPAIGKGYERAIAKAAAARVGWMECSALSLRMVVLGVVFVVAALLVAAGSYSPFIYFRF